MCKARDEAYFVERREYMSDNVGSAENTEVPRLQCGALAGLRSRGLLRHGSGTFGCGDFSLRL